MASGAEVSAAVCVCECVRVRGCWLLVAGCACQLVAQPCANGSLAALSHAIAWATTLNGLRGLSNSSTAHHRLQAHTCLHEQAAVYAHLLLSLVLQYDSESGQQTAKVTIAALARSQASAVPWRDLRPASPEAAAPRPRPCTLPGCHPRRSAAPHRRRHNHRPTLLATATAAACACAAVRRPAMAA